MFVVWTEDGETPNDAKAFSDRSDARAYARKQVDDGASISSIFEVQANNAPAAVAALKMGDGHFLEAIPQTMTDQEYQHRQKLEWERAQREGPAAMLKLLGL